MKNTKTTIVSMLISLLLVGIGVYLFILDNERRHIKLTDKNIHIVLSESEWTTKNYELTIKYDGLASRHIKGYSFDGGNNWSSSNLYYVEKNEQLKIEVKDINNKIYSFDYEIKNIDREGPKIEVQDNIQVLRGSKVNFDDYVTVTDEGSGLRDKVVYTPNSIDTSKLGEYTVQIYAIDKLANKTISSMKVNVVDKIQPVNVSKIVIEPNKVELKVDEENILNVSIEPKNATNKTLKWSSSDESIVSVDVGGKIKALKAGEATVTVTSENGVNSSCLIIVK